MAAPALAPVALPTGLPAPEPVPVPTGSASVVLADDAIGAIGAPVVFPIDLPARLESLERSLILQALQQTGFNRTAAAPLLGLSFRQLRYRIQQLGIRGDGREEAGEALDAADGIEGTEISGCTDPLATGRHDG